ncbi:MAG TPA: ABC transporter ATP-binding protein, partial [Acidobacteriota bacterium]|nr:ABC transporter ATP-binding protein [Acidobacteriota bacterium]
MQSEEGLRLDSIGREISNQPVLSEISLKVAPGELMVLLGPSGSGKTTLLRIIAGLDAADRGSIYVDGQRVDHLPASQRRIGLVFQEHALFDKMTVENNIAFGLKVQKYPRSHIQAAVTEMLRMFQLEDERTKFPSRLSVGQKQRVAIARTLAAEPKVLLLDEPLNSLGSESRLRLRRKLSQWTRSMNVPTLFVTQDPEEALEMGDQIAFLNRGRIEQIDTPSGIYNHPKDELVARFLGAANVLIGKWIRGNVVCGPLRLQPPPDVSHMAEGQHVRVVFRPEDVVLNFQPQLLQTPYYLGRGIVEEAL